MSETERQRRRREEENRKRRASGLSDLDPIEFASQFGTYDEPSAPISGGSYGAGSYGSSDSSCGSSDSGSSSSDSGCSSGD